MTCFEVDEFLVVLDDLFDVALSFGRSLWFGKFQTIFCPSNELRRETHSGVIGLLDFSSGGGHNLLTL